MRESRWVWLLALALSPACLQGGGSGGGSGGVDDVTAAANSLTDSVAFEGGTLATGEVPEADDDTLVIEPLGASILVSPGDQSVIMPLEFDDEGEEDPIVATLIHFKGARKHIEVMVSADNRSVAGDGRSLIENRFDVEDGVCDRLCNRRFDLEVTESGKRQSGKIGQHARRTMQLDCSERGSESNCNDEVPVIGDGDGDGVDLDVFECRDGGVVEQAQVCDGTDDCADGSDEASCPSAGEGFTCLDGTDVVVSSAVCDGLDDCMDGSDELNCADGAGGVSGTGGLFGTGGFGNGGAMGTGGVGGTGGFSTGGMVATGGAMGTGGSGDLGLGFECSTGEAVAPEQLCDGTPDCMLGDDEGSCQAAEWMCDSGEGPYPPSYVCDEFTDCADGSDEARCIPL